MGNYGSKECGRTSPQRMLRVARTRGVVGGEEGRKDYLNNARKGKRINKKLLEKGGTCQRKRKGGLLGWWREEPWGIQSRGKKGPLSCRRLGEGGGDQMNAGVKGKT